VLMCSDQRLLDKPGCPLPDNGVAINTDFDVSVCGLALQQPGWALGNLKESSLEEIRSSERWQRFREAVHKGSYPSVCTSFCSCVFSDAPW